MNMMPKRATVRSRAVLEITVEMPRGRFTMPGDEGVLVDAAETLAHVGRYRDVISNAIAAQFRARGDDVRAFVNVVSTEPLGASVDYVATREKGGER